MVGRNVAAFLPTTSSVWQPTTKIARFDDNYLPTSFASWCVGRTGLTQIKFIVELNKTNFHRSVFSLIAKQC